jgi:hypothetical protein
MLFLHDCVRWYLTMLQANRLKAILISPPLVQQPLLGQYLFIVEASWSRSVKHSTVRILWTNDQLDAETYNWKHSTIIRERHPWPRRDSNPQSQQAGGSRPKIRPLGHWDEQRRFLRDGCLAREDCVMKSFIIWGVGEVHRGWDGRHTLKNCIR